jgi:hypothetical protein
MQEACAHTKVCLARLSECLRPAFGLRRGLGPDVLRCRCLGVGENVLAVRRGAAPPRDVLAREPLVEIPATGDLGQFQQRQNSLDIVDPKAVRPQACRRRALRPVDELPVRQTVLEWCQTLLVAQL